MIRRFVAPVALAFAFAAVFAFGPSLARADIAPPQPAPKPAKGGISPKLADVKRLLELTGAAQLGQQVMQQLIPSFRATMPNVPQKFWDDFAKEANPNELVDRVALIYDKHLSHDEVKGIIAFYQTPAGKKLVSVMPQVTQESMQVGQQWGRELGERIARKLEQGKGGGKGAK